METGVKETWRPFESNYTPFGLLAMPVEVNNEKLIAVIGDEVLCRGLRISL